MNVMHQSPTGGATKRPAEPAATPISASLPEHQAAAMADSAAPDHLEPEPLEAPPRARSRPWLWGLLALVLAGGGYWLLTERQEQPARPAGTTAREGGTALPNGEFRLSDAEMRALRIEPMHRREFRAERVAEGRITLNEDRATPVFSPYNGRVVRALARMGDQVQAGDTLLEIETTDLAAAANDLLSAADNANKARATLDQARREEARQASLFAARAASQRDVEQARTAAATAGADLRSAEASLATARDKLRVLGRSPEQIARIEETRRVDAVVPVVAPIGGIVTQRRVGPGQWLSTGASEPVYTIADLSTMWLVAAVREMDAPLVRPGQPVKVSVGALPGRVFDARITAVGAGLDPVTRRMTVRAEVQDPERLLKPEMFATFHIAVGEASSGIAVPVNAVIHNGPEASVWVALPDNRFVLRRIQPGIRDGDVVEVTEGLEEGERVVTGGALFIDRAARID